MQDELLYLDQKRVMLKYLLPLSEIVVDFYDQVKSISSGYARYGNRSCNTFRRIANSLLDRPIIFSL